MEPRTVPTAAQVMRSAVFVLPPTMQVLDAVDALIQRGISGAPVVEHGRLVGVFSERDALTAVSCALYEDDPPGTVEQHMRRDFAVVAQGADLYEVAEVFRDNPVRRVPVVDHQRRLLGILSRADVLKALRQRYRHRPKSNYERLQEHLALRHGD